MKLLNGKKSLYFLSLIATVVFAFIPGIGIRGEGHFLHFGFPAQWLGYFGNIQFSFQILGFLFNFYFFYFAFVILNKILFKVQK
ncbi:hypothetical protein CON64_14470 [Bacillus pseudomycoides]|nr:hypothetical protein CON64_14470 [Bacillus pseudomycoides]